MSDVVSVRVPKELKERMKKYRVNLGEEVRRFLEERVRVFEFLEMLDNIERRAKKRRIRIDSAELIREMREKH